MEGREENWKGFWKIYKDQKNEKSSLFIGHWIINVDSGGTMPS